jgi:Ca2+-transporting ATPase
MSRRPRDPKEKFVDAVMLRRIAVGSLSLAAAVVFNYLLVYGWGRGAVEAQTVAFATWLIGHIFLALTMRSQRTPLWKLGILSNKTMVAWAGAAVATLAVVTSIPAAREAVKLSALGVRGWLLAAGVPFVSVFWQELGKLRKAPADRR